LNERTSDLVQEHAAQIAFKRAMTAQVLLCGRVGRPGLARHHGEYAHDEGMHLLHMVAQERFGGFVAHLAVLRDQARLELGVAFHGFYLR